MSDTAVKRLLADRRLWLMAAYGFVAGLPLPLSGFTFRLWLSEGGVSLAVIGLTANIGLSYSLKFLWAPLLDNAPPPGPLRHLGRRRGWLLAIQPLLVGAAVLLALSQPAVAPIPAVAAAALVAFLSASQDVVIDAYRVEILTADQQGPGAAMIQTGYRIAMLVSGAGALIIAARFGWFAAYATVAALLAVGMLVFIFGPEPTIPVNAQPHAPTGRLDAIREWLATAVVEPFADFMLRPRWLAIVIFIVGYKLGEALAGVMANPLYISLGFSLDQIAYVSKLVGFFATVAGALVGGVVATKLGVMRALILCGVLQSAGNLFYVLQAVGGHRLDYLALCVAAENFTGAMAGTALVAYLSDLCSPAFTATQYALLSSLAAVGRTMVASSGGVLADRLGWVPFFLLTTVATIPALLLLLWIARRDTELVT